MSATRNNTSRRSLFGGATIIAGNSIEDVIEQLTGPDGPLGGLGAEIAEQLRNGERAGIVSEANPDRTWREDLADAQRGGFTLVAPDLDKARNAVVGELLFDSVKGDPAAIKQMLGKLKLENTAMNSAGEAAALTAKRISTSLAAAADDYKRQLAEKDREIARLKDQLESLNRTIEEAKNDAEGSSREWFSKEEVVRGLAGVAVKKYPGRCGSFYFPQSSSGGPVDFSRRLDIASQQLESSGRGALERGEVEKLLKDLKTGDPFCGIYISRGSTGAEIVVGRLNEMLAAAGQREDLFPLAVVLREIPGSTRPADEILEANFPKPVEVVEILDEPVVADSVSA